MSKSIVLGSFILLASLVCAYAQGPLAKRSVVLRLAMPDGRSLVVQPEDPMPKIEAGMVIEALPGGIGDVPSVDLIVNGHTVHLTPGKIIATTGRRSDGGVRAIQGKVTVTGPHGRVKILRPAAGAAEELHYVPPAVPDPDAAERKIKADEDLPDISPIHA